MMEENDRLPIQTSVNVSFIADDLVKNHDDSKLKVSEEKKRRMSICNIIC